MIKKEENKYKMKFLKVRITFIFQKVTRRYYFPAFLQRCKDCWP